MSWYDYDRRPHGFADVTFSGVFVKPIDELGPEEARCVRCGLVRRRNTNRATNPLCRDCKVCMTDAMKAAWS